MDIDFVITWVDGNDPSWQKLKLAYENDSMGDSRDKRYREWNTLKYWFRGVEKFAPWVHRIFFVTYGHIPSWMNTNHPKLEVVNHSAFIPEEYLPTFSCRPIELNLHRISGLSDHFVYFNDDMFLLNRVSETDFFRDGLPCDTAILDAAYINGGFPGGVKLRIDEYNSSPVMNMVPLNRNFDKKKAIRKNCRKWLSLQYGPQMIRTILLSPWKYFTGIKSFHLPYSYLKSSFTELWEKEPDLLNIACLHKFRDSMDVSSRLFSYWQLASGTFSPRSPNFGKMFSLTGDEKSDKLIFDAILHGKWKTICINDEFEGQNFIAYQMLLTECFDTAFPEKSAFEL